MREQDHSDKNQALFKQEPSDGEPRISLRDYIARHMNGERSEEAPSPSPSNTGFSFTPSRLRAFNPPLESSGPAGQRLNQLDVEMGAGLEQYLPTPLFRLRVAKKRVSDEINDLRARINKYERLPDSTPDLKKRISALKEHLLTLERHQIQIDEELSEYLSGSSKFLGLIQQSLNWRGQFAAFGRTVYGWLTSLIYGSAYRTVAQANAELHMLQELFAERLQDQETPDVELGQLLNRYEKTLRQVEGSALQFRRPFLHWIAKS
ncbi:MAG TPA: hypothetical protein V6C99_07895 [Oculatellaceae cyanobacterium]|jgi:hypothetical protein